MLALSIFPGGAERERQTAALRAELAELGARRRAKVVELCGLTPDDELCRAG